MTTATVPWSLASVDCLPSPVFDSGLWVLIFSEREGERRRRPKWMATNDRVDERNPDSVAGPLVDQIALEIADALRTGIGRLLLGLVLGL